MIKLEITHSYDSTYTGGIAKTSRRITFFGITILNKVFNYPKEGQDALYNF